MVGEASQSDMIVGIITGVVGLIICVLNYPIYSVGTNILVLIYGSVISFMIVLSGSLVGFSTNILLPYVQSAGLGLNALFTYTICGTMGFTWQQGLTMVFICGIINVLITITNVRKK